MKSELKSSPLKALFEERSVNSADVARRVGISKSTMSRLVNDIEAFAEISVIVAYGIANAIAVDREFILSLVAEAAEEAKAEGGQMGKVTAVPSLTAMVGKVKQAVESVQRKTKGRELIPLSTQAMKYLDAQRAESSAAPDEFVFPIPNRLLTSIYIKAWVKQAGINKRVTFHVARHTAATMLITSGVDLYTVSKLLGHRDVRTTQIYAKIIDEKKRDAMNSLPTLK